MKECVWSFRWVRAVAVRELCDMRDWDAAQVFNGNELNFMIDTLCTK